MRPVDVVQYMYPVTASLMPRMFLDGIHRNKLNPLQLLVAFQPRNQIPEIEPKPKENPDETNASDSYKQQ